MKVLYGINANGQGHINRSRIFINQLLRDGHEVHVLLSGKDPPKYAYDLAPKVLHKPGPTDYYDNHKLDINKVLQINLLNISDYTKARKEVMELDYEEKYDTLFSDFDIITSGAGKRLNKPVICIDHHHALFHPSLESIPKKQYDKWAMKMAISIMMPYFSHCYALDFTDSIDTAEDVTLFPLIWKPEFDNYKIIRGNHIIVYLSWYNQKEIIKILTKFPEETFYVYGFNKLRQSKNVIFKRTSREEFLSDLVSSKAVIGNAGFNLCWEACLLKKMIWLIPLGGQFEQYYNAYRLQKLEQAYMSEKLTTDDFHIFKNWIENLNYIPQNTIPYLHAADLLKNIYSFLNNYKKENFLKSWQFRRNMKLSLNPLKIRQEIKKEVKLKISAI